MLCRSADALHKKSYLTTEQDNALLLMVQAALGRLVSAPRRSAEMKVGAGGVHQPHGPGEVCWRRGRRGALCPDVLQRLAANAL